MAVRPFSKSAGFAAKFLSLLKTFAGTIIVVSANKIENKFL
jgi:hypothetical protein